MGNELFIGNLDRNLTSEDLEGLFSQHGNVERANVVTDKATGQSKGFGFVRYSTSEEASAAISQLNGYEWNGRAITVSEARAKGDAPAGGRREGGFGGRVEAPAGVKELFVSGLDYNTTSDDLKDLFGQYGDVLKAKVVTDRETGRSKGFGFVQMSSTEENEAAIGALHDSQMGSRTISVNEAKPRESRPGGGFGGGGGRRFAGGGGGGRGFGGGGGRSRGY